MSNAITKLHKKTLKYAVKAVIKHINEIETLHTCYFV